MDDSAKRACAPIAPPSHRQLIIQRNEAWAGLTNQARADIRAGHVPYYPDHPHVARYYEQWCAACNALPPSHASVRTQQVALCKKRKKILDKCPAHLRKTQPPHDELRALGLHDAAEGLLDIEWRMAALRPRPRTDDHDWQDCVNRFKLKRRLRKYENRLQQVGQFSGTPEAAELQAVVDAITEKLHLLELEEYEARLREWQHEHPNWNVRRPVKARSRAYRIAHRGGRRGSKPGGTWAGSDKPRRPSWLKAQDEADRIAAIRERKIERNLPDLPEGWHEKEQERQATVAARRAAAKQARARSHLEALQQKLLDWVWGEARAWGVGLDVDGWRVLDAAQVPCARQREHVLASVAVRLSGGEWAFPPLGRAESVCEK